MNAIGKLNDLGLTPADAVVIGSGILGALGIRESNDIDLIVTEAAFARLSQDRRFKKRQSHGREELAADFGEVGTYWTVLDRNWTFDDLCDVSVVIDGVRYVTPEFLLTAKRSWLKPAGKPKDVEDVESIESYLAMRAHVAGTSD